MVPFVMNLGSNKSICGLPEVVGDFPNPSILHLTSLPHIKNLISIFEPDCTLCYTIRSVSLVRSPQTIALSLLTFSLYCGSRQPAEAALMILHTVKATGGSLQIQ